MKFNFRNLEQKIRRPEVHVFSSEIWIANRDIDLDTVALVEM